MSARNLLRDTRNVVLKRSHQSPDVAVYAALKRLLHGGPAAESDSDTYLLAMLDQGIVIQKLLDQIVFIAQSSQPAA